MYTGPKLVTDGLVLTLDAASTRSYPGSGTTWYDLSGNGHDFTLDGSGIPHNSDGYFDLESGGASYSNAITTATECTLVFWLRTTDAQSLFWSTNSHNGSYVGAYRVGNKFYNSATFGSPTFHTNTVQRTNIYDFIRTDEWMMMEFKDLNMSAATSHNFNQYGAYTFDNGAIGAIHMYDRTLTAAESEQNYNALRSRFGV